MNDQTERRNREHWIKSLQDDIVAELRKSSEFKKPHPSSIEHQILINIDSLIEQSITLIWTELDGDEPVQPSGYDIPDDWREGKLR